MNDLLLDVAIRIRVIIINRARRMASRVSSLHPSVGIEGREGDGEKSE